MKGESLPVLATTKQAGFTLIEVLIAVIILAIALIAVVKNTTLSASETSYLQQRSIAHWAAMDIMSQAQSGLIHIDQSGNNQNGTVTQLGQQWHWQLISNSTAQKNILKITVKIINSANKKQYANLQSYLLVKSNS
jgi:general secretion pathway protein I